MKINIFTFNYSYIYIFFVGTSNYDLLPLKVYHFKIPSSKTSIIT